MSISRGARRLAVLVVAAAITAPLAQAAVRDAAGLDVTNLPCTPSCSDALGTGGTTEPSQRIFVEEDSFDWSDAGVGAGIGVAAMLAGLAGAFEARRHRSLAQ